MGFKNPLKMCLYTNPFPLSFEVCYVIQKALKQPRAHSM